MRTISMRPWLEALAVALLGAAGFLLGRWFSRLPKPYWTFGYFLPLVMIILYGVGVRIPSLSLVPPISWMMIGRNRFAWFNFAAVMVLATPLARLPQKRNRIVVCLFMFVLTCVSTTPSTSGTRSVLLALKKRIGPTTRVAASRSVIGRLDTMDSSKSVRMFIRSTSFPRSQGSSIS